MALRRVAVVLCWAQAHQRRSWRTSMMLPQFQAINIIVRNLRVRPRDTSSRLYRFNHCFNFPDRN